MTARSTRATTSQADATRRAGAETAGERALAALLPATGKWTRRFIDAVTRRDSGWHRLAVKIERGQIKSVQILLDEQVEIEFPQDGTENA